MKVWMTLLTFLAGVSICQAEVQTREITYQGGGAALKGFLAYDDAVSGKRPGILVVHEWWGHNQHARDRARKLAAAGYTALAVDMYGDGKSAEHPKKAGELMNAAFKNWKSSQAKFIAGKKILQQHPTVDPRRIGAIGFCFGGAVSLRMVRGGADLAGVVAFHSALPLEPPAVKGRIKAAALVINGSEDSFLDSKTVADFVQSMVEADADLTYVNLPGVRHSYTNPGADAISKKFNIPNIQYNAAADKRAWSEMLAFFARLFKS